LLCNKFCSYNYSQCRFFGEDIMHPVNLFSERPSYIHVYLSHKKSMWENVSPVSEHWYQDFVYVTTEKVLPHNVALQNKQHNFKSKPNKF
jgi:hypothetical protein